MRPRRGPLSVRLAPFLACIAVPVLAASLEFFNGDFEQPGLTVEGVPVGWHIDQPGHQPSANIQATRLRAHDGQCAVRIGDNDGGGYSLQSRLYPALVGQTYKASAWVLNLVGDGWLYLEFYAEAKSRVSEKHVGGATPGEWGQLRVEDTCPAGARYVAVLLYSSVANRGEAAWDTVALEGPAGAGEVLNLDKTQETGRMQRDPSLTNVGDQKQLLFDDAFFASHKGFWWRICPPRKTGERNLIADKPWESFIINAWMTVMEDEGRYRMWYEAYDKSYAGDDQARYCYAESSDAVHWTKPVLNLDTFGGSTENNILFNRLGGAANHGGTVFRDPTAPAAERYKFIYLSCDAKRENWFVYGGHSADGLHWQRYDGGPILRVGSDTQTVGFWDEALKQYVAYCRLWTAGRTIGRAASADFLHFPMAGEVLGCDERDPPDTDMYNSAALKYPYAANAYFIFTSVYNHPADNLEVQLAVSRDGVNWSRPERRAFIPNGEPGSFDDATVYCGVGLIRREDELSMYYHGSRARHNQVLPNLIGAEGVYSRAVLALDRYVALDAAQLPAEFVTLPLTFSGATLEINAVVRPQGEVRFELQDAAGTVLPGYALAECPSLQGDNVRHRVSWKNGADLRQRAGAPTRLRCVAKDASLYAFQFAK